MLLIIVHLLLCLSLHACSARPLQVNTVEETGGLLRLSVKETKPAMIDEFSRVKEKMIVGIGQGTTLASCCGENTIYQKISEELGGKNVNNKGKNMVLSYEKRVLRDMIKAEDEGRQARNLESLPSDNAEQSMGATENDVGEVTVVMDYAQPHRKSPIHNKKP